MSILLSELDGTNGFRLNGINAQDYVGLSVSSAGDINGDGLDDVIIGGRQYAFIGDGRAFVVFGSTAGFSADIDLSSLDGSDGFRINGLAGDETGRSVAGIGDFNNDGIDDVIIGAPDFDVGGGNNAGASFVVFGSTGGFASNLDLSTLNGTDGFRLDGDDSGDRTGFSSAGAGDINGDGINDIIIGAQYGASVAGESYVVFGSASNFGASIDLSTLDGTDGFRIDGDAPSDVAGRSVSGAGDINGDGIDDLIIGASGAGNGEAYVVFGRTGGFSASLDLTALDGSNGFRIDGDTNSNRAGYSVSRAGDVNGDGIDDLIIGDIFADIGAAYNAGESYVVFGTTAGFSAEFDLSSLDGTNGFRLQGIGIEDFSGSSVSNAGDFNNDGFDDLIIGAPRAEGESGFQNGQSYLIFGSGDGFASTISLSSLDGTDGFIIEGGTEYDFAGISVSGAGDINGDGFDDLIIGATSEVTLFEPGSAFVIFGFATTATPTPGPDTLVGSNGNDTIDGLGGADLIQGLEGADSLRGSAGKDTIEGGDGRDTLLGGGGNDDLDGGVGNDLLRGENGRDFLFGGAGADTLEGRNGNDTLEGGAGPDNLLGGVGEDTATYVNSASAVTVNLATGTGSGGHAQGDSLNSVENLIGSNLSDNLTGDGLANRIQGGNGNDTIDGANGNDRLFGDLGGDSMAGGLGNDTLIGGSGGDSMEGGGGTDSLSGSDGSDTLRGGDLGDSLSGGLGEDELFGDGGNDILRGNNNPDLLDGGAGIDTLIGGNGSDTLVGGTGNDSLNGSAGLDRYVFRNGDGNDTISLFQDGLDTLDLSQHTSVNDFGDITKTQQGANLLVTFDGDDSVLIENFLDGNLTGSDFFFGA